MSLGEGTFCGVQLFTWAQMFPYQQVTLVYLQLLEETVARQTQSFPSQDNIPLHFPYLCKMCQRHPIESNLAHLFHTEIPVKLLLLSMLLISMSKDLWKILMFD